MAGFSPAPLPSLSLVFPDALSGGSGAAAFLPSIGLNFGGTGNVLAAGAGSFALTGVAASLRERHVLTAAAGSYAETGVAASLTKATPSAGVDAPAYLPSIGLVLTHDATKPFVIGGTGAFLMSGVASNGLKGRGLTADTASFAWTGAPAQSDSQVTASGASFAWTGVDASVVHGFPLFAAGAGTFALTGNTAALTVQSGSTSILAAFAGSFALTGNDALLPSSIDRVLQADVGAFAMTGQAATFVGVAWVAVLPPSGVWTNVTGSTTTWTHA